MSSVCRISFCSCPSPTAKRTETITILRYAVAVRSIFPQRLRAKLRFAAFLFLIMLLVTSCREDPCQKIHHLKAVFFCISSTRDELPSSSGAIFDIGSQNLLALLSWSERRSPQSNDDDESSSNWQYLTIHADQARVQVDQTRRSCMQYKQCAVTRRVIRACLLGLWVTCRSNMLVDPVSSISPSVVHVFVTSKTMIGNFWRPHILHGCESLARRALIDDQLRGILGSDLVICGRALQA